MGGLSPVKRRADSGGESMIHLWSLRIVLVVLMITSVDSRGR